MRLLVDTGIFVGFLNDEPNADFSGRLLEKIQDGKMEGFISTITIAEIFSIYHRVSERRTMQAKAYIESVIGDENIMPVFKEVSELAGKVKATHKVSLGDAVIIATAAILGCDYLVTLDREIKAVDLVKAREPKELT